MIEIQRIKENKAEVIEGLKKRGIDSTKQVEQILLDLELLAHFDGELQALPHLHLALLLFNKLLKLDRRPLACALATSWSGARLLDSGCLPARLRI